MVDIDIGGTEQDEMEDVIPVEEVEVVEDVGIVEGPTEPAVSPPIQPPAGKKPSPWIKRMLVIAVVIILIIVAVFGYVYLRTDITDVRIDLTRDEPGHEDELLVTVMVGSSGSASIAGDADLQITYDDEIVYTSKISINDAGTGRLFIPYTSFLEGNGNYYVKVKYRGTESPLTEYKEEHIIESLNITAEVGKVNGGGQLNMTVFLPTEPEDSRIRVDEIKNLDDNDRIAYDESYESLSETTFVGEFITYSDSGNYSFTVTVENSKVKSDSEFYEVTETTEIFLNILPEAYATYQHVNDDLTTFTVQFDASASWNDGDITSYVWDFDDDGNIDDTTTVPTVTYTYAKLQAPYDARLTIFGDVLVDPVAGDMESGFTLITVTAP